MMHDVLSSTDPRIASDQELIRRYAKSQSETAFRLLMQRHLARVYSVCKRDVRNATIAEDAAQVVFLLLARKAPTLHHVECLSAWLYRTARLVCRNLRRQQARLARYEASLDLVGEETTSLPLADEDSFLLDALDSLNTKERNVILLRFFEEQEFAEIGRRLGISEDAARMRVNRALGKMHTYLSVRGITPNSDEALVAALTSIHYSVPVPSSCTSAILHLVRIVTLSDSKGTLPIDNPLYIPFEGVRRTMRFHAIRPVAITVAVTGALIASLIGVRNLRAAPAPQTAVASTVSTGETQLGVVLRFRLIERVTNEGGITRDNVLNSPVITARNGQTATVALSTGAETPNEKKWITEALPRINADGTITLQLTYRIDETISGVASGAEAEETVKEQRVTSKLRLKNAKAARISLMKGTRSEFLLEVIANK